MKLDFLLPPFLSNDPQRPALCQANQIGEWVYATDGHALMEVPYTMLERTYEPHKSRPDVTRLLDAIAQERDFRKETDCVFSAQQLSDFIKTIPQVPLYAPCDTCEGKGSWTCGHCQHTHDCDTCNTTGEGSRQIGVGVHPKKAIVQMPNGEPLYATRLSQTIAVANALQLPIHYVFVGSQNHFFRLGDVLILAISLKKYDISDDAVIYKLQNV